jgi:NADH:ubiquinone oxidoreductase subunit H
MFLPYVVLIIKILLLCLFAIGTRGTLPRYRFDQFTQINWKYLVFGWLIFIFLYFLLIII